MSAPYSARVDDVQLARLLDIARLRTTTAPMPAEHIERYELDKPWARLRLDEQLIELGTTNALTKELYARAGDLVYSLPVRIAAAIPSHPAKLLAHRLFGPDEQPRRFEFERFSVQHDGVRWSLDPSDPTLSQDDLVRWSDRWRNLSSTTTQPAPGAAIGERIVVTLSDARRIVLDVLARSPDVIVRRQDEALQYHLPAPLAEPLLAPPNAGNTQAR
jgi:hypothetical protein